MISFVEIDKALKPHGLQAPAFHFLTPDEERYSVLLYQPTAEIEYDPSFGLRSKDRPQAKLKFLKFLQLAASSSASIATCPEYSCPWDALFEFVDSGKRPEVGTLWALGCEALSLSDLKGLQARCDERKVALVLDEPQSVEDGKTFVDPLCYLFVAQKSKTKDQLVMVVQLKTEAMGDKEEGFEPDSLRCGRTIYKFRNAANTSITFFSLICSDVLTFGRGGAHPLRVEIEKEESLLLLHLQLNGEPRQNDYVKYREFCMQERSNKDILCLNWGRGTVLQREGEGKKHELKNSCSALYAKELDTSVKSTNIQSAQRAGLYLTHWKTPRSYVAFVNFEEVLVTLALRKPSQIGASQPQRKRDMPKVVAARAWNGAINDFDEPSAAKMLSSVDGCCGMEIPHDLLQQSQVCAPLVNTFAKNPFDLERLVALSTNRAFRFKPIGDFVWPSVEAIESFVLGPEESIRRLTFIQDQCADASSYRKKTLMLFAVFDSARQTKANFPEHVAMFANQNFPFVDGAIYYVNLKSDTEAIGLFVLDDEASTDDEARITYEQCRDALLAERLAQQLRRHRAKDKPFTEPVVDENRALVWYRQLQAGGGSTIAAYPRHLDNGILESSSARPGDIRGH
jgi:hypothetical protein